MNGLNWPPRTQKEFDAWLRYQKAELTALPLVPKRVKLGEKTIDLPDELREEIAASDDPLRQIYAAVERYLVSEHLSEFVAAGSSFTFC